MSIQESRRTRAGNGARLSARGNGEGTCRRRPACLECLAAWPLGALVLFVAALAVYAIEAIAWPLKAGRELDWTRPATSRSQARAFGY